MKRAESFNRKTLAFEPSALTDRTNQINPRPTTFRSNKIEMDSHLFKVTTKIPIRVKNISSNVSPKRGVQSGRVGDTKPKKSIMPLRNVNYSRNLVFFKSRNTARKEILKKVVEILNEGKQFKPPTPDKSTLPIPRTPGSAKGYLAIPEYKRLKMRQEAINQCKDFYKKKEAPGSPFSFEVKTNIEQYKQILSHCTMYSSEADTIYQKIKKVDEDFENKAKNSSEFFVYQNYQKYETQKNKLYEELKELEENFRSLLKSKMECGSKLNEFFKTKKELFENIMKSHEEFKSTIQLALEKSKKELVNDDIKRCGK